MTGIHSCTLVLEYNYSTPATQSKGTVWLRNGDGTDDLSQDSPLSELPEWFKIVRPIDYEDAAAIHLVLKKFFEESGVSVIDQGIAD